MKRQGHLRYLGVCSRLRETPEGEENWHRMMNFSVRLHHHAVFLNLAMKDEGPPAWFEKHTGDEYYNLNAQDTTAHWELSRWGDAPCVFYQNAGFEHVWLIETPPKAEASEPAPGFGETILPDISGGTLSRVKKCGCGCETLDPDGICIWCAEKREKRGGLRESVSSFPDYARMGEGGSVLRLTEVSDRGVAEYHRTAGGWNVYAEYSQGVLRVSAKGDARISDSVLGLPMIAATEGEWREDNAGYIPKEREED